MVCGEIRLGVYQLCMWKGTRCSESEMQNVKLRVFLTARGCWAVIARTQLKIFNAKTNHVIDCLFYILMGTGSQLESKYQPFFSSFPPVIMIMDSLSSTLPRSLFWTFSFPLLPRFRPCTVWTPRRTTPTAALAPCKLLPCHQKLALVGAVNDTRQPIQIGLFIIGHIPEGYR